MIVNLEGVRRGVQGEPDPLTSGGVRWKQPMQAPECLGKSLSDWGD